MPVIHPPTNGIMEFELHREAMDESVLLKIPNRGSFYLTSDEVEMWMSRSGVHPLMVNKMLDYVWNFRRARYVMREQRFYPIRIPKDRSPGLVPPMLYK